MTRILLYIGLLFATGLYADAGVYVSDVSVSDTASVVDLKADPPDLPGDDVDLAFEAPSSLSFLSPFHSKLPEAETRLKYAAPYRLYHIRAPPT